MFDNGHESIASSEASSNKSKGSLYASEERSVKRVSVSSQDVETSMKNYKHKILTQKSKMGVASQLHKCVRNLLIMKRSENDFKSNPEWDSSQQCLMKDMIESKKNYQVACEQLKNKLDERAKLRVERDKEIKELEDIELKLGDSFVYYDKFVKENIEKKERAVDKIRSERAVCAELEKQIEQTDRKIERLTEIKHNVAQCIEDRKVFVDFLESVHALAPDEFTGGIHEIAERYEVLKMIRDDLAVEQAEAIKTIEDLNCQMNFISDKFTVELINLRNKHTILSCRYDNVKHEAFYWESIANKIQALVGQASLEHCMIKHYCSYHYKMLCELFNMPMTVEKDDVRKQLAVIEEAILMLRRALYLAKRKVGSEKSRKASRSKTYLT